VLTVKSYFTFTGINLPGSGCDIRAVELTKVQYFQVNKAIYEAFHLWNNLSGEGFVVNVFDLTYPMSHVKNFYLEIKIDELVKSPQIRHSREACPRPDRGAGAQNSLISLDSRLRGNDKNRWFLTFYECIKINQRTNRIIQRKSFQRGLPF